MGVNGQQTRSGAPRTGGAFPVPQGPFHSRYPVQGLQRAPWGQHGPAQLAPHRVVSHELVPHRGKRDPPQKPSFPTRDHPSCGRDQNSLKPTNGSPSQRHLWASAKTATCHGFAIAQSGGQPRGPRLFDCIGSGSHPSCSIRIALPSQELSEPARKMGSDKSGCCVALL